MESDRDRSAEVLGVPDQANRQITVSRLGSRKLRILESRFWYDLTS